jgi:hypothetical protein
LSLAEHLRHDGDTVAWQGQDRVTTKARAHDVPPKFSTSLKTYSRLKLVHLPRYPLPRKGGKPLYALGELGERLEALKRVHRSGVECCELLEVAVIPAWHLPRLRKVYPTRVYHNGDRAAYLVTHREEARLGRVIREEEQRQLRGAG